METIGIRELKENLSRYMKKVKTGENIIVTHGDSLNFSNNEFSIELLVSLDNFSQYDILIDKYAGGNEGWYLSLEPNSPYTSLFFKYGDGTAQTIESTSALEAGVLTHVMVCHNGDTDYIYLDGELDNSDDSRDCSVNTTQDIKIGGKTSYWLDGQIYLVRLYNVCMCAKGAKSAYLDLKRRLRI